MNIDKNEINSILILPPPPIFPLVPVSNNVYRFHLIFFYLPDRRRRRQLHNDEVGGNGRRSTVGGRPYSVAFGRSRQSAASSRLNENDIEEYPSPLVVPCYL